MSRQSGSGSGRNRKHDYSKDSDLLGEYFYTLYHIFHILDTLTTWEYWREALLYNIKKACHPEDCLPHLLPFQLKGKTNKQSKISLLYLNTLINDNDNLKKHLMEQINVEDWTYSCCKCGYPKLIHKNLHWDATCTEKQETPEALIKYWDGY